MKHMYLILKQQILVLKNKEFNQIFCNEILRMSNPTNIYDDIDDGIEFIKQLYPIHVVNGNKHIIYNSFYNERTNKKYHDMYFKNSHISVLDFIPPIVKAVQEVNEHNETNTNDISQMKEQISSLEKEIITLKESNRHLEEIVRNINDFLNMPNF